MADVIDLKAKGLFTHPNPLDLQPGSLLRAKNCTIDREGIVDTMRGAKPYGDAIAAVAKKILAYSNRLIVHHGTTLSYDSDGAGTWADYSGTYSAPTGEKIRSVLANQNIYFTTSNGIKRLDVLTGTPADAGMYKAIDGAAVLSSAGSGWFAVDNQVAYRIVWGIKDANLNLILGAPSQLITVTNPAAGAEDTVALTFSIPTGITTSHFYQIYRSALSGADDISPTDELQLVLERHPTSAQITAGTITVTDVTPDALRGATLYTSPSQQGIAQANDVPPLAKDVTVYKDHTIYANTQTKQRYTLSMISIGSGYLGTYAPDGTTTSGSPTIAALTSMTGLAVGQLVTGTGIAADSRVIAVDVGASTVTLNKNATASGTVTITFRDRITIDGVEYWANSTTSVADKYFACPTGGTPADNIEDAAQSLCAVINQNAVDVYGFYLSGFDDLPGKMLIEDRALGGASWAVTSSKGTAFSTELPESGTTQSSTNETKVARIYVSKPKQPDAVPILQYFDVGSADDPIVRCLALRDSVFFLKKTEGVWRMTGDTPTNFDIKEFDRSASIRGAETAVVLNNAVWCYSTQGVISVSDNGVQVWSRPIERDLLELSSDLYSSFETIAFGVAYETDRKYQLWLPTETADTYATQARIYNTFTGAWTEAVYSRTCGLVNPDDDKEYMGLATDGTIYQERKSYSYTDYAEEEFAVTIVGHSGTTVEMASTANAVAGQTLRQGFAEAVVESVTDGTHVVIDRETLWAAGAAVLYNPIVVSITWAPLHAGNPKNLKQFSEMTMFFDDAEFETLDMQFDTDFSTESASFEVEAETTGDRFGDGGFGDEGFGGVTALELRPMRTYIPLEQQRAHWLSITIGLTQALKNIGLAGLGVTVNEMDSRF